MKDTMHFLITGHTGFKGAWLSLLLRERGHTVSGISLDPEPASLFIKSRISDIFESDIRSNICDLNELAGHFEVVNPDFVIHLAAQALVGISYENPIATFNTNVMGTINVLKASEAIKDLQGQLIVTTDKVYKNINKSVGYHESDPLGGKDPYSASKAMADIGTQSWLASFSNAPTAIARAGNVIGGGDVCKHRLIPDLVESFTKGQTAVLRAPNSVRPWQHVLDCLNGYLILVDAIIDGKGVGAWNFGPLDTQIRTVADVCVLACNAWGIKENWKIDATEFPQEASLLLLNSTRARTELGWKDKLNFEESVNWTMNWYKNVHNGKDPLEETLRNIREFELK
jgi:CDP-glucose 4,6-dehydratase